MIWNEVAAVPQSVLPISAMREHLRLGTGFADDGAQDSLIEAVLRAAIGVIERRTGKALIERDFRMKVEAWRDTSEQVLPVAPVSALVSVSLRDAGGATVPLPVNAFRLVEDGHCPRLAAVSGSLPPVPPGGAAETRFTAGYGPAWADVPPDLRQAVLLLASHYHENRHAAGIAGTTVPFGVQALIDPWRTIRTFGGGRG